MWLLLRVSGTDLPQLGFPAGSPRGPKSPKPLSPTPWPVDTMAWVLLHPLQLTVSQARSPSAAEPGGEHREEPWAQGLCLPFASGLARRGVRVFGGLFACSLPAQHPHQHFRNAQAAVGPAVTLKAPESRDPKSQTLAAVAEAAPAAIRATNQASRSAASSHRKSWGSVMWLCGFVTRKLEVRRIL